MPLVNLEKMLESFRVHPVDGGREHLMPDLLPLLDVVLLPHKVGVSDRRPRLCCSRATIGRLRGTCTSRPRSRSTPTTGSTSACALRRPHGPMRASLVLRAPKNRPP